MPVKIHGFTSRFRTVKCYESIAATLLHLTVFRHTNMSDLTTVLEELSQVFLMVSVGKVVYVDNVFS